ncbi:hypothetical protein H4R24_000827 [Coemansia sp. RSA 988]|nr:hypothetical protein H4R24_000827 [Coemansia sp. RSA 988]
MMDAECQAVTTVLIIFALLYLYDHGERFEEHGFYNLLVFLLIFIPLNITIAILYTLFSIIPNFVTVFTLTVVGAAFTAALALNHYISIFGDGMLDHLREYPSECRWQGNNYPIFDLLPSGTQNFWAGSMHCKPESNKIDASIDTNGLLTINCTDNNILVDILPDTRVWPLKKKSKWQVFNHHVLEETRREEYTGPLQLEDNIQAVVVRCGINNKIITRVSPRASVRPAYTPPTDTDTRLANISAHQPAPGVPNRRPNVLFVFIDATSHRQFYRRLQKSAVALANLNKPGRSELTELYRYHTLGVSTDNSTKAMYIGEIVPTKPNPLPIWAYFRDRGYVTARVETSCEDWTRTYLGEYYTSREYSVGNRSLDYELSSPFCMPEFYPSTGNAFGNFKGPFSITARCLYGRYVHEYGFDYIDQLRRELRWGDGLQEQQKQPYFLMLNLMEGHEGTGEVLRTLDNRLSELLSDLDKSGELEDTALFILSDHGLHMGLNFAFLNSGQIEHKNPFFAMVLPHWLRNFVDNQPEAGLPVNEQRLTTPLETHYTLKTLASWPMFDIADYKRSLFSPVPAGRSCSDAGIGSNFCMCKV